jgi:hypothetical protein
MLETLPARASAAPALRVVAPLAACALLALADPALGSHSNLLSNPGFATDLADWTDFDDAFRTSAHDPEDRGGDPASGSALLTALGSSHGGILVVLGQCVDTAPGSEVEVAAWAKIASGQSAAGAAWVIVEQHLVDGCAQNSGGDVELAPMPTVGSWRELAATFTTAEFAESLFLLFGIYSDGGEGGSNPLAIRFDDAWAGPPRSIFRGDFEDGTLDGWSAAP